MGAIVMVGLWAAAPQVAQAQAISVQLPDDPAPCSPSVVAAALAVVEPKVAVRTGGALAAPEDVVATLSRSREGWSLSLSAPGQAPLERHLPSAESDCLALAQTVAFMTQRYLIDIHWVQDTALVPPPPRSSRTLRNALGLGIAVEANSAWLVPALAIDVDYRFEPWTLGFGADLLLPAKLSSDPNPQDAVQSETLIAELAPGWRHALGPGALGLAVTPGLELTWAWTGYGQSQHLPPVITPRPFVGIRAGWELILGPQYSLAFRLAGRLLFGSAPGLQDSDEDRGKTQPNSVGIDGEAAVAINYFLF